MISPATTAPLQAVNLGKRYGRGATALRGVDIEIETGTITGLVGPNGAGKSTLMRAWMGFEKPSSGRAFVMGHDVSRSPDAARKQIGYVPQTPGFFDGLSVVDHVRMAGLLRRSFDASNALERLDQLDVPGRQLARTLSGGQRAQVALSLALATEAPILLLDEPLANLDPLARRDFLQQLRIEMRRSTRTVVLSSHVISDVAEACDRLVLLGAGQVLLNDSIAQILAGHGTAAAEHGDARSPSVVARFLGPAGESLALHRHQGDTNDVGRPATLEEVVLGYLSSGRGHADDGAIH
jgi:ABC-2 type transport system ATP-binding protein